MIYKETIKGKYVDLRYADIADAIAILNIRQDPSLTKFLPRLDISVEEQERWLAQQQKREGDYYFVVCNKEKQVIGTVRVYNVHQACGETGSIAIKGNALQNMEAKLLCDRFAFETLGLETTKNLVRMDNERIIRFVENFGVVWEKKFTDEHGIAWMIGQNTRERAVDCWKNIEEILYTNIDEIGEDIDTEELVQNEQRILGKLDSALRGIDFAHEENLVERGILDSLSLMSVVAILGDLFSCKIPFTEVNAKNFNSVHSMALLITRLLRGDRLLKESANSNSEKFSLKPLVLDERETEKSVVQRIMEYALERPNDLAIIANEKETSYKELASMIWSIYNWLSEQGMKAGYCIVVQAVHEDICIACYYAIHLLGAKLVPVEKNAAQARILEIAHETKASFIVSKKRQDADITWKDYAQIREIAYALTFDCNTSVVYPDVDLPCEMVFTTGTTGKSKGVLMTHRHMSWYAYSVAKCVEMKRGNRFLITTPLNHAGGLRRTHLSLANGCCVVYLDGLSDFEKYFRYISQYKVTSLYLPPVAIRILLARTGTELAKYKNQIDFVYSSSSSLPMGDGQALARLLPDTRLYNAYEASETPGVSAYNYNTPKVLKGCMGRGNMGVELAILSNGIITSQAGVEGQICVRSKMNMKEYYLDPELTRTVWKDDWFISNDLGHMDEKHNIYYSGRKGDVINLGGYKIAPTDVEEIALLSGMIDECILVEAEDEYQVPYLKLLVVAGDGRKFDVTRMKKYLSDHLEAYKVPRGIELVDEVAKTFNGKIDRKAYRKM